MAAFAYWCRGSLAPASRTSTRTFRICSRIYCRSADTEPDADELELEALIRNVRASLEQAITLGKNISPEVMAIVANLEDPGRLADVAASNLELKVEDAQSVLEKLNPSERLRRVNELLAKEIEVLTVQQEINTQAKGEIDRSQREFYLRQQLKAIQTELGEGNELAEEIAQYREKMLQGQDARSRRGGSRAPDQKARTHASRCGRNGDAAQLPRYDGRAALVENFQRKSGSEEGAQTILNEDHYGLEKVKERIIEALAVRKIKEKLERPDPLSGRPAGRRQNQLGPLDCPRAQSQIRQRLSLGGVAR